MQIDYKWVQGALVTDELIEECSKLYSSHYGVWGQSVPPPCISGENIRLSPKLIKKWLENENSVLYMAKDENFLIGYVIAIRMKVKDYGIFSWVTQLVVHEQYRNMGVAKNLLFSIWGLSNDFAWGIISANPYAIRALEKATRRRSNPSRIKTNATKIRNLGIENIPYMNNNTVFQVDHLNSKIDTEFFVDHSNVAKMIKDVTDEQLPWLLGTLDEGWEWLAFTFNDQEQISLTKLEIEEMIEVSDRVTKTAYEKMTINYDHKWAIHTEKEVDYIIKECSLNSSSRVIDFGCGNARHSISLAERGMEICAIDYVDHRQHIDIDVESKYEFVLADCRDVVLEPADAVLCLYDVVGTYVDFDNNMKILKNIAANLKDEGSALISVMNYDITFANAKHKFSMSKKPDDLLKLKASNTMQTTGNIFDPEFYLLDSETGIVYRKEQFLDEKQLPIELIVRDKRFKQSEIELMCEKAGLIVESVKFVQAGKWDNNLNSLDSGAKEILIKCTKKFGRK